MGLECFCKPVPEVGSRLGIVEDITHAKHRIDCVASRDVEDPRNDIHTCPRQFFVPLFGEGQKTPSEVPVGRVQQLQHDVSGFGAAISNTAWNNRVTFGAR